MNLPKGHETKKHTHTAIDLHSLSVSRLDSQAKLSAIKLLHTIFDTYSKVETFWF